MARVRVSIWLSVEEAEAYKAKCAKLQRSQSEVARDLFGQFVQVGNGRSIVLPGDVADYWLWVAEQMGVLESKPEQAAIESTDGS